MAMVAGGGTVEKAPATVVAGDSPLSAGRGPCAALCGSRRARCCAPRCGRAGFAARRIVPTCRRAASVDARALPPLCFRGALCEVLRGGLRRFACRLFGVKLATRLERGGRSSRWRVQRCARTATAAALHERARRRIGGGWASEGLGDGVDVATARLAVRSPFGSGTTPREGQGHLGRCWLSRCGDCCAARGGCADDADGLCLRGTCREGHGRGGEGGRKTRATAVRTWQVGGARQVPPARTDPGPGRARVNRALPPRGERDGSERGLYELQLAHPNQSG